MRLSLSVCVFVFFSGCFLFGRYIVYISLSAWANFSFPESSEDADFSSGAGGRETLGDEPGRFGRRSM